MTFICPLQCLEKVKIDSFCNINLYFFGQHVKMMSTQFLVDNMYLFKMQRLFSLLLKKNQQQDTGNQEK